MGDRKHIYLMRRVEHDSAKLLVKQRLHNAAGIEKQLHRYFKKSRFTMTKKVPKGKWMQAHIKIGISKNADQRLKEVNRDIFKSGKTEWFAMHLIELFIVQMLIFWYAYRWYMGAIVVVYILYVKNDM